MLQGRTPQVEFITDQESPSMVKYMKKSGFVTGRRIAFRPSQ
jgi:hypothetical protein